MKKSFFTFVNYLTPELNRVTDIEKIIVKSTTKYYISRESHFDLLTHI